MLNTLKNWLHPKFRNRIALDYPLDCLLNRSCRLSDYEHGAFADLRRYNSCVYAILSLLSDDRANSVKLKSQLEEALAKATKLLTDSAALPSTEEFAPLFHVVDLPRRLRPHWNELQDFWYRLNLQYTGLLGALQLPHDDQPLNPESELNCSGNILIRGRPGTGKSTLAMQMALAATSRPNHYDALLLAMEEDREHVLRKAHSLGLTGNFRRLQHLGFLDESSDSQQLAESLRFTLLRPGDCPLDGGTKQAPVPAVSEPCVLLPRLSPRSIRIAGAAGADLFWERFGQLERLLHATKELRRSPDMPDVRMVCIDGLSAFGERSPTRDEIAKLFELFQRTGVIGVVTAEQEAGSGSSAASDALEYLSDIVINLTMEEDRGYSVRYLEVVKSRYHHEVYGRHFVRLRGSEILSQQRRNWSEPAAEERVGQIVNRLPINGPCTLDHFKKPFEPVTIGEGVSKVLFDQEAVSAACEQLIEEHNWRRFCCRNSELKPPLQMETARESLNRRVPLLQTLMVQPSVHYVVGATEGVAATEGGVNTEGSVDAEDRRTAKPGKKDERFSLGEENLDRIIKYRLPRGRVVTIKGPPGTYKSIIAKNFIFHGISNDETVLYIGLAENTTFDPLDLKRCLASKSTWDLKRDTGRSGTQPNQPAFNFDKFRLVQCRGLDDAKRRMKVWESPPVKDRRCRLYDLAVKGGALLPEEMLEFVRDILRQEISKEPSRPVGGGKHGLLKRVVLDDVALIGASYPFLRESRTAGDLFLPAFVHLMRNYGVDLLLVGTTGQLVEGDRMVDRASLLADTVLTTSHTNVFGDRYVTVTGEGLAHAGMQEGERDQIGMFEYSPGVVCADPSRKNAFKVDLDLLKGLVGFGTDKVSRPKLIIQIPDQPGKIYEEYKQDVEALIHDAMGSEGPSAIGIQGTNRGGYLSADSPDPVPAISDSMHSPLEVLEGKASAISVQETNKGTYLSASRSGPSARSSNSLPFSPEVLEGMTPAARTQGTHGDGCLSASNPAPVLRISDPVHSPLEVLEGKPLEHTVVCMLDEFWKSRHLRPALSLANLKRYFLDDRRARKKGKSTKQKQDKLPWKGSEFIISPYFSEAAADGKEPLLDDREESPYAVPFYGNVLLVAYHEDVLKKSSQKSRLLSGAIRTQWKTLCSYAREHGFDCDTTAKETLACLLLDALLAAAEKCSANQRPTYRSLRKWRDRQDPKFAPLQKTDDEVGQLLRNELISALDPKGGKHSRELLNGFVSNMIHIAELLNAAKGHSTTLDRRKYILNDKAKLFVCWYSQLRQLIDSPNGERLASKMRICAMPGGGFRGDWYLAVAKGSVSLDLGVRAVEILTRRPQEYDRFVRGLGLPVRNDYREKANDRNLFAWPHAKATTGNTAEDLFKIHRAAYSRASIPEYTNFRRMLAIMVDEVLLAYREHKDEGKSIRSTGDDKLKTAVKGILMRLPHQIELLVGSSP